MNVLCSGYSKCQSLVEQMKVDNKWDHEDSFCPHEFEHSMIIESGFNKCLRYSCDFLEEWGKGYGIVDCEVECNCKVLRKYKLEKISIDK